MGQVPIARFQGVLANRQANIIGTGVLGDGVEPVVAGVGLGVDGQEAECEASVSMA